MRAAIYHAFKQPIAVETVADPDCPPDGVVLRVLANGVCRSDWHGWMGHDADVRLPHVPGHELAGEVVAVGADCAKWRQGARVVVPFVLGCGRCPTCADGHPQVCDDQQQPGFTYWGGFAEYVAVPRADLNLVALPEALGPVEAASLGCRFTTAYRAVVEQGAIRPEQWLAVHGCGGVGLSAVMIGAALGARVIAVDIDASARKRAGAVGAEITLDASAIEDIPTAIREATGGGAHVSLDALGHWATCRNSILCLRTHGSHVQVGLLAGEHADPRLPMSRVIGRELRILGSHGMAGHRFPSLFELIAQGRIDPGRLIARRLDLEAGASALMAMDQGAAGLDGGIAVIDRF